MKIDNYRASMKKQHTPGNRPTYTWKHGLSITHYADMHRPECIHGVLAGEIKTPCGLLLKGLNIDYLNRAAQRANQQ